MNGYDQTFNPNILIGHYDLISWFSDFALYLKTEWVYDHIPFTLGQKKKVLCFRFLARKKTGSVGRFYFFFFFFFYFFFALWTVFH